MTYEELNQEIASRGISQLPGILQHVVAMCARKPVFKDKDSMLRFVNAAWDYNVKSVQAKATPRE